MIEKIKKNLFFLSIFFLTIFWNKDKIKEVKGESICQHGLFI